MAELNEMAGPAIPGMHDEGECPFCREDEPMEEVESDDEADLEEDPSSDDPTAPVTDNAKLIGNNSGKLDKNMRDDGRPRPQDWIIDVEDASGNSVLADHQVTPNPHHLIPGNESLKKSVTLLEWIFASKGKIASDVGYDVNNAANGIWLPSNNSMRGNADWRKQTVKRAYVIAAMRAAGGHFHDRHGKPYSAFVTKILNKIADRMNGVEEGIPDCPEKDAGDGKLKPPYGLVTRLNGVSQRLAPYLQATKREDEDLYTSKLVPSYWWDKKRKRSLSPEGGAGGEGGSGEGGSGEGGSGEGGSGEDPTATVKPPAKKSKGTPAASDGGGKGKGEAD